MLRFKLWTQVMVDQRQTPAIKEKEKRTGSIGTDLWREDRAGGKKEGKTGRGSDSPQSCLSSPSLSAPVLHKFTINSVSPKVT